MCPYWLAYYKWWGKAGSSGGAHKPVSEQGPDSIRNGLALSGTFHWLFDRGLISISDDYKILVAEKKVPDQARKMLNNDGKIILPNELHFRPNPHYLKFHREFVFKG